MRLPKILFLACIPLMVSCGSNSGGLTVMQVDDVTDENGEVTDENGEVTDENGESADENGYTAKYECRAGGPNCNVDVAALEVQACQQTIETGAAWNTINWSNNVICLAVGDHTAKGTLTIGSSGTSGTRKILRSVSASDPWTVASESRARVNAINVDGDSYWIISRLSVQDTSVTNHFYIHAGSNNIILSRILSQGYTASGADSAVYIDGADGALNNIVVQNSVVRSTVPVSPGSSMCSQIANGSNIWFVNNEFYDCSFMIFAYQSGVTVPGWVVENNDLYVSPAGQNTGGTRSYTEAILGTKADATAANPARWIHNRFWGMRKTAGCCDGGGPGSPITTGGGEVTSDYFLIQDNIIWDSHGGLFAAVINGSDGTDNNSFVGNLLYDIKSGAGTDNNSIAFYEQDSAANETWEIYLNTVIRSNTGYGWLNYGGVGNSDIRCNVIIDSDAAIGAPGGSGTQTDYNVYYGTPHSGEANRITPTLSTRANNTEYNQNDVIRTTDTPPGDGTAGDYLYRVTIAGKSAVSPPAYSTSLGGTTVDGTMTVQAVRGPHTFYRKLKTGAELVYIPYAKMHSGAQEYNYCPNPLGSRTGIGINDDTAGR